MTERNLVKIKKINESTARVLTNHPTILHDLYNYFSVYIDKHWFHPKVKCGLWDGKIHFINKNGSFNIGLLKLVYRFIKRDELKIKIDKSLIIRNNVEDFSEITNEWLKEDWVPRKHQITGAESALKYGRGILEHATASGKSLTIGLILMYRFIKGYNKKALILVPTLGLIEQLKNDLISYGVSEERIGKFSGKQKETENPIIISTWQSMAQQKKLTREFDMLIVDEVHSLKGDVVRSVSENAINASFRIGCTGTMPDIKVDEYRVISTLGPILHRVTPKQIIDAGHASDIRIKIMYLNYPEEIQKELKGSTYEMEKKYLETSEKRCNVIKVISDKHLKNDHNVLILVNKLDHADFIYKRLEKMKNCSNLFLVNGSTPPKEREEIRQFTNSNKRVIIIATSGVFSVGISIKRLHGVIFADAGKSKIRTMQSVGRGLRLHDEKKRLTLYDIGDSLKYADRHLEKRIGFYDKAEFDIDVKDINL